MSVRLVGLDSAKYPWDGYLAEGALTGWVCQATRLYRQRHIWPSGGPWPCPLPTRGIFGCLWFWG